ncbi:MAG: hypothetical protein H6747_01250 [Deltaproteobacteria bacterium]|nr:hypothetical protein [Deltaproteobacteria bacterium]
MSFTLPTKSLPGDVPGISTETERPASSRDPIATTVERHADPLDMLGQRRVADPRQRRDVDLVRPLCEVLGISTGSYLLTCAAGPGGFVALEVATGWDFIIFDTVVVRAERLNAASLSAVGDWMVVLAFGTLAAW